jgi:outer membrane lipoprotein-sorting protein
VKKAGLIALIIIPLLFACAPKKTDIPMTALPADPLLQALDRHRRSFTGLKAIASVEIVKRGRKRTLDTVGVVVDGQQRLRVEAYGPMGQSLMAIVWDGRDILLRLPEEEGVVLPGSAGLERLFGEGLEASELCALLSGNIPGAGESAALLLCGQNGDCLLEMRSGDLLRRVRVSPLAEGPGGEPRILAYELHREEKLLFQARFDEVEEISHYRLPMKIVIENPGRRLKLTVLYSEAEVNTPISDDVFSLTDEAGAVTSK